MRRGGQEACVLAGLLICLALTVGLAGSPPPVPRPTPSGGDDIPFPTWDVPTSDAKSASTHPRVPAAIVPEGVAVLLLAIIWTASRALLSGWLGYDALGRHGVLDPDIILLPKPFTPESLMHHLRRALDGAAKRG